MGEHKAGTPGMIVEYPDGYVSWSPTSVFEAAYREVGRDEFHLLGSAEVPDE